MSFYVDNLLVTVCIFILLSWGCWLPLRGGSLASTEPVYCAALAGYFAAYTTTTLGWPIPVGFVGGVLIGGLVRLCVLFFFGGPLNVSDGGSYHRPDFHRPNDFPQSRIFGWRIGNQRCAHYQTFAADMSCNGCDRAMVSGAANQITLGTGHGGGGKSIPRPLRNGD